MTVVIFNVDQTPYCKGDTINLSEDELKAVDAVAEKRGVNGTYKLVEDNASDGASELEKPLNKMNKTELLAVASDEGLELSSDLTNKDLVKAIQAHRDGAGGGQ